MAGDRMQKRDSERPKIPLTMLRDGETGIVASIKAGGGRGFGSMRQTFEDTKLHHIPSEGVGGRGFGRGWGFEQRLMDLGLTPGTTVTVVKSAPFHGPVEILVRGSRLALGRGMAEKILVEIEKR
jgi:Fe2+ transport system protein FeoA